MHKRQSAGWFDSGQQRIFHWYLESNSETKGLVVLIPPLGHESFHSHRFYRHLAQQFQRHGFDVIRFDLPGHGDSTGNLTEPDDHLSWMNDVRRLIEHYRQDRPLPLVVGGLRFGGNLAAQFPADHYVLIEPIISPKRYVRELTVAARVSDGESTTETGVESGGFFYSHELLAWIKNTDTQFASTTASGQIILSQPDKLKAIFSNLPSLEVDTATGLDGLLAEPQYSTIPPGLTDQILGPLLDWPIQPIERTGPTTLQRIDEMDWQETCFWDPIGQFGILCEPAAKQQQDLLVFLNSGSGPHSGPNRLYTETCRKLAAHGVRTLRVDLKNLGDSATDDVDQENHCYPEAATEYCHSLLKTIQDADIAKQVTLAGICSGAHHAFHGGIAGHPALNRVILINPLTFYWQEGMSLATPDEQKVTVDTHYYAQTLRSGAAWKKLLTGQVSYGYIARFALKYLSKKLRTTLGSWRRIFKPVPDNRFTRDLSRLTSNNIDVRLIIAEQDPGWGLLADESQMSTHALFSRFSISGVTVKQANHTFSRQAAKPRLVEALLSCMNPREVKP